MKNLHLRTSLAFACALSLAACGGDNGNLLLGGTVSGLNKEGLVLQNNGGETVTVLAGSTTFRFPTLIGSDTDFDVTIKTMPSAASCTVSDGKGKTGAYSVTTIRVACATFRYDLGGTVSGLDVDGLIINNGDERLAIAAGATSFVMTKLDADGKPESGQVEDGAPYGVTIFQQPTGRVCSINNGTNTMGSGPVTNIQITCI